MASQGDPPKRVLPPGDLEAPVGRSVEELAVQLGEERVVGICAELLAGGDRDAYLEVLPHLTGLSFDQGAPTRDRTVWKDYWVRTWGARGLLYVWRETASRAIVEGLADAHWRPAEMCLKVATKREIGEAGPGAALLVQHPLPRVRSQAVRALGAVGDTEHIEILRGRLEDNHPGVRRQAGRAIERLAERLDLTQEAR
ncbi:MAG: HEAT repeat domain-containing protein [Actinomycetota bacterium]|nr:HEAT repeat domain-containing protein [Actinomycetota bacterium]